MQAVHSQLRRNRFRNSLGQIGVLAGLFLALVASSDALAAYEATNLVSDIPGAAKRTDANLVNPWGIAVGSSGTIWVANNGTGTSTLYDQHGVPQSLVVNDSSLGDEHGRRQPDRDRLQFRLRALSSRTGPLSGPSVFIFVGEDGSISGWSPTVDLNQCHPRGR